MALLMVVVLVIYKMLFKKNLHSKTYFIRLSENFESFPYYKVRQLTSLSSTAGEWNAALWKLVSLRASQNGPFFRERVKMSQNGNFREN